jgi:hypothetical protein
MEFVEISYTLENEQQFWDGEVFCPRACIFSGAFAALPCGEMTPASPNEPRVLLMSASFLLTLAGSMAIRIAGDRFCTMQFS